MGYIKKKINVQDLEVGMRIADLDRPWLETPMLFQGDVIHSQSEIDELKRYCNYVYITVSQSGEAIARRVGAVIHGDTTTQAAAEPQRLEFDLLKKAAMPQYGDHRYPDQTTLEQEVKTVRRTHHEARMFIKTLLEDARARKSLDMMAAKRIVGDLTDSILRNPDALMCFCQLKNKHEFTAEHSLRVCVLALTLGRHLGLEREALHHLGTGALLHDIGKVKVPGDLLEKSGALAPHDVEIMRYHVQLGVSMLRQLPDISPQAVEAVREHHERYDGSGYPDGLKANAIGLFGQITGLADHYDTMTSDWADHSAISGYIAIRKLYELRNKEFHHELLEKFIQCMGVYPIGTLVELNTGEVGVVVTMNRLRRLRPRVVLVLGPSNTAYEELKIISMMHESASDGRTLEIERAIAPGTYGIDPQHYLSAAVGS